MLKFILFSVYSLIVRYNLKNKKKTNLFFFNLQCKIIWLIKSIKELINLKLYIVNFLYIYKYLI
jgi:hypothetical protein